jgi:hypothetical protein
MLRTSYLAVVAMLVLAVPATVMAESGRVSDGTFLIGEPLPPSHYWIGLHCMSIPGPLRSQLQLPEKQGMVVVEVFNDSPASKAGFAKDDVLLRAGGKALADVHGLLAAIEAAKETKLKIDLIRGGKPLTIEVTPAKRPAAVEIPQGDQADWETIQKWLEEVRPEQNPAAADMPFRFKIVGPGMIVPGTVFGQKPLPAGTSVMIVKEGDQPAKITVKRGDQKWEVTEKELDKLPADKLPADVRPYIDQMLGRGMSGVVVRPKTYSWPMPPVAPRPALPPAGVQGAPPMLGWTQPFPLDPRIEKRFDELNARMDRMLKMMEEMRSERPEKR